MSMMAPISHPIIVSVLAFVMAAGGSYGGYKVIEKHGKYGAGFEESAHVVVEVVDGDTIVIDPSTVEDGDPIRTNGSKEPTSNRAGNIRVRLLGIDAPEKAECYGEEAKAALSRLVLGQRVILEKDRTAKDSFGRLLRYVILHDENPEVDDVFVGREMVRGGFARVQYVKPNRRYLAELQAAERGAQEEERGMWGECDVTVAENAEREEASESFSKECVIKGNINKRYEKDYFLPGCPNYKRVKVDERKGEMWFCSEREAQDAGWQMSAACGNVHQFGGKAGGRFE